jgi:hypothetical protein
VAPGRHQHGPGGPPGGLPPVPLPGGAAPPVPPPGPMPGAPPIGAPAGPGAMAGAPPINPAAALSALNQLPRKFGGRTAGVYTGVGRLESVERQHKLRRCHADEDDRNGWSGKRP